MNIPTFISLNQGANGTRIVALAADTVKVNKIATRQKAVRKKVILEKYLAVKFNIMTLLAQPTNQD